MKIKRANPYCRYVFGLGLFFLVFSHQVLASDCELLTDVVNQQLQDIHADIISVASREQYEKVIKKRYDRVEGLLKIASDCSKKNNVWSSIKDKLSALRSNARSLAFKNFENWLEIREKDMSLFSEQDSKKPGPVIPDNKSLVN